MVGSAGFEPATCRLGGGRSIQLSYEPFEGGAELGSRMDPSSAWTSFYRIGGCWLPDGSRGSPWTPEWQWGQAFPGGCGCYRDGLVAASRRSTGRIAGRYG